MTTAAEVWAEIGKRLRGDGGGSAPARLHRFEVVHPDPLQLRQVDGEEVLEDGDPDFSIGAWVRQYTRVYGLSAGDVVRVALDDGEWTALEVETERAMVDYG